MKRRHLTDAIGVVVLAVTAAALAVYFGLFERSMLRQPTWEHLIALLFLWQTQTGAAFAIAAALIGAIAILRQTAATEDRAEDRRKRRASALRAVLPLMLAELSDYAADCAGIFGEVIRGYDAHAKLNADVSTFRASSPLGVIQKDDWPFDQRIGPLPSGFTEQLIDLIETIPSNHARPLVALIRCVQIQHSRAETWQRDILSNDREKTVVRDNLVDSLIDACEVQVRCDALFAYARGEVAQPPATISADAIAARAFFLVPNDPPLGEVKEKINRLATTDTWPN